MGKREIRTIRVPKAITIALLLLVSAAMAAFIYLLSGRAYATGRGSIAEILATLASHPGLQPVILATLAPAIADILFFVPWGALAFLSIDRRGVPKMRVYLVTLLVGVAFALGLVAWQRTLPTRVTGRIDALWNAIGCLCGAFAGHLRKRMRIRFE